MRREGKARGGEPRRPAGRGRVVAGREIPASDWERFFESLGRTYEDWKTTLEVRGRDGSSRADVHGVALASIGLDGGEGGVRRVSFALRWEPDTYLTHAVVDPVRVTFEEIGIGGDATLFVGARSGGAVVLRFRRP